MPEISITLRGEPEQMARTMSAVASAHRLAVLAYFEQSVDGTATLDELAEFVLTQQDRADGPTLNQVRRRLYHVDLPRLAAASVVEVDTNTGSVEYRGMPAIPEPDAYADFDIGTGGVR